MEVSWIIYAGLMEKIVRIGKLSAWKFFKTTVLFFKTSGKVRRGKHMRICVYVYMEKHIYMYMYICIYVYMENYIYRYMRVCIYVYMCIRKNIHAYMNIRIHAYGRLFFKTTTNGRLVYLNKLKQYKRIIVTQQTKTRNLENCLVPLYLLQHGRNARIWGITAPYRGIRKTPTKKKF